MSEDSDKKVIAHLGFIETTITRMGQNSFHAKTWCMMIVAALLTVNFTRNEGNATIWLIFISLVAVLIFCVVDAYYLHLERGYRYLYNVVAGLEAADPVRDYDMRIPKSAQGFKNFKNTFKSWSIILFYGALAAVHILLIMRFV